MTKQELQEKLAKAQENVFKVENTIKRHEGKLEKLNKKLEGYIVKNRDEWYKADQTYRYSDKGNENYWLICDIERCNADIKSNYKKLEEKKAIVKNWQEKIAKSKEEFIPECLVQFRNSLVSAWDNYDIQKRDKLKETHKKFKEWLSERRYSVNREERNAKLKELDYNEYEASKIIYMTDEEIHKDNLKSADNIVKNLIVRVQKKCGEINSWKHLEVVMGNQYEGATINGYVEGTLGKARVESILAGGYNIQKLHIRTLVK